MRIPPPSFGRLQAAYRAGDHAILLFDGDRVAQQLAADPATADLARDLSCMIGAVHAGLERYAAAASYLEYGLAGRAEGNRPDATLDWFALVLLDVYVRTGRYDDALARVTPLLEPERALDTRFSATRAQAAVATARGDYETAQFLLNTATGLSLRIRSHFRGGLVEGDRAVLLAHQNRLYEAIGLADRIIPRFVRPALGEYQRWGNQAAAAVALTLARLTANAGDDLTAQRLLIQAATAVERAATASTHAHLELARGAYATVAGDVETAETSLRDAHQAFEQLGCAPASAVCTLEQGRLAERRDLLLSAKPLYERALNEFRGLGQPREVNECRTRLAALAPRLTERSS